MIRVRESSSRVRRGFPDRLSTLFSLCCKLAEAGAKTRGDGEGCGKQRQRDAGPLLADAWLTARLEKSATAGFVGLLNRAVGSMSTGNVNRCRGFRIICSRKPDEEKHKQPSRKREDKDSTLRETDGLAGVSLDVPTRRGVSQCTLFPFLFLGRLGLLRRKSSRNRKQVSTSTTARMSDV